MGTKKYYILVIFFTIVSFGSINAQTKMTDLVDVQSLDSTIIIDIKYATADNFLGDTLYTAHICLLRFSVAEKIVMVQKRLRSLGYGLKIWDGYRPLSVQKRMWEKLPDPGYVANPKYGSNHNRGAAVDVTLVDSDGNELEMPTKFDDFTKRASSHYPHASKRALKHRKLLQSVMKEYGFSTINSEWWHFNYKNVKSYPVLDIPLKEFVNEARK